MAKKRKGAEVRRPIKAKGSLPAPKTSPTRRKTPWRQSRWLKIFAGVVVLGLVALGVQQFFAARESSKKQEREKLQVGSFDRSLSLIDQSLQKTLQEMDFAPSQITSGQMSPDELKTETGIWLGELRKAYRQLANMQVPQGLEESRALLVQAAVISIDAAKLTEVAAKTGDPAIRYAILENMRNVIEHSKAVYTTGRRALAVQKAKVGLAQTDQEKLLVRQVYPLPDENAQPPLPPPATTSPAPAG